MNDRLQEYKRPDIDDIVFDIQSSHVEATEFVNQYFEMKEEVERLQAENEKWGVTANNLNQMLKQREQKVERLDKALKDALFWLDDGWKPFHAKMIIKQALETEGKE